jgi:hypothetical protein
MWKKYKSEKMMYAVLLKVDAGEEWSNGTWQVGYSVSDFSAKSRRASL